jgi:ABC-type Fe3+-hydroxamate transport system substrate-binding protein
VAPAQRLLAAAAIAAGILLVAGCGERSEPTGTLSVYPVTVQGAGEAPTRLSRLPERVVPLARGLAAIVASLGRSAQTAGMGEHPVYALGGKRLERELRRLRPDLVVAPASLNPMDVHAAVDPTAAQLYVFPDTSLHDVEQGLTQLGLLLDAPATARGLVHRLEQARRKVAGRVAGKPRVRVFVDAGFATTIGSRTLLGDLIHQANGVDVAGTSPGPAPLTAAELDRLDPDVYLALSTSGVTLAGLRRGKLANLRAVRDGRFAVVDARFLAPGPRLDKALEQIARALHPAAFASK